MSEIVFSNWKNGVDVRRSELTTNKTALLQCQDAIINEGAEIENRYAFTNVSAAIANTATSGSLIVGVTYTITTFVALDSFTNVGAASNATGVTFVATGITPTTWTHGSTLTNQVSFGLEQITSGLLTFGSVSDPGGWTSPVSYQRLQHPAVAEGGAVVAMTSVICSTSFGNAAWVVAQFADGVAFGYYNGTVIPAFRNGQVLTGLASNTNIATQLSTVVGALSGFHVTGISSSSSARYFDMYSDVGINYQPVTSVKSSAAGTITAIERTQQTVGTPEILATAQISVWGGATGSVTKIEVNGVDILGSTVNFTTDNNTTAQKIVNTIVNYISSPDYTAVANNNVITISATPGAGAGANGFVVKWTTTGDFIVDNTFFTLPSGSGNACQYVKINTASGTDILGATVTQSTTVAAWATAIAAQINSFQAVYNAFASQGTVYVSKKVRASNDTFETALALSLTTGAVTGNTSSTGTAPPVVPSLVAFASPTTSIVVAGGAGTATTTFSCAVAGGVPNPVSGIYSYQWSQVSFFGFYDSVLGNSFGGSNITSPTNHSTSITVTVNNFASTRVSSGYVTYQCIVTDFSNNAVVSNLVTFYVTVGND